MLIVLHLCVESQKSRNRSHGDNLLLILQSKLHKKIRSLTLQQDKQRLPFLLYFEFLNSAYQFLKKKLAEIFIINQYKNHGHLNIEFSNNEYGRSYLLAFVTFPPHPLWSSVQGSVVGRKAVPQERSLRICECDLGEGVLVLQGCHKKTPHTGWFRQWDEPYLIMVYHPL